MNKIDQYRSALIVIVVAGAVLSGLAGHTEIGWLILTIYAATNVIRQTIEDQSKR